ncbi:MlaE family ABC transporter permease [Parvularcula lutaonensis]|uniref:MlaE family ABC transporter permease n=1 Tax=Parvularcula lutaonensis TaxID=491923 RepID=A0ABV7MDH6_9PROT|nr:ABC transporter permease [Parvularcula lutaonensis]GGY52534.1 ABC transporter permease [Parvularcula lutaonensis]
MANASFTIADGASPLIYAAGEWTLDGGIIEIDPEIRRFAETTLDKPLTIDMAKVEALDTSGAMILQRTMQACGARTDRDQPLKGFVNVSEHHRILLEQACEHLVSCEVPERPASFLIVLERVGKGTEEILDEALHILSFVGAVIARMADTFRHPRRFRLTSVVYHMETSGLDALFIVGLMSFLIGAVVAFMGATVLADFGAEVFAVELVGISVLREFGVLLTAILIAGRSGSSFTAAIGSMKLREEIDAMRAMGIDPLDALVVPRVVALLIAVPCLAFVSAVLGLIGGGAVCALALDIPPALFMARTQEIIVIDNFVVGMVKAPFFAFAIGVIGCYHGMMVESSAEDLGRRTTIAVVQSLFLVILTDALFAVFFMELDY